MVIVAAVAAGILGLTLLVVAFQALLLRQQLRDDHEWRRRDKALSFSQIDRPDLREVKTRLADAFGYIQTSRDPLPMERLEQLFKSDLTLRNDMNLWLSYLENMGLAVKHNIASFTVIYDMLCNTYLNYVYQFDPYIKHGRQTNPRLWENVLFMESRLREEKRRREGAGKGDLPALGG